MFFLVFHDKGTLELTFWMSFVIPGKIPYSLLISSVKNCSSNEVGMNVYGVWYLEVIPFQVVGIPPKLGGSFDSVYIIAIGFESAIDLKRRDLVVIVFKGINFDKITRLRWSREIGGEGGGEQKKKK